MRRPQRAAVDDRVDRPQVGAQRCVEPSGTNCPRACAAPPCGARAHPPQRAAAAGPCAGRAASASSPPFLPPPRPERDMWRLLRGGAPLPIPNREVKPRRADDTASLWESRSPPTFNEKSSSFDGLFLFPTTNLFSLLFFLLSFFLYFCSQIVNDERVIDSHGFRNCDAYNPSWMSVFCIVRSVFFAFVVYRRSWYF